MMLLSRFWYVVLSLALGAAAYVVFLAVGQYNRRNALAMAETLASDSQTVGWALQIDARRRLDALLVGAVDKGIQDALTSTNGKEKIPAKAKEEAKKALAAVSDKVPAELRPDALFAVDRDGRVVAQTGFDQAAAFDDFELGGYAAVNDALHGYLRDDTWLLGGRVYRVVTRPVEYDVTQPPAGAIVGIRLVDARFAQELAKRTRANVAFYSGGQRIASGASEAGFDDNQFEPLTQDLGKLDGDKNYKEAGRSEVRPLGDRLGAMYARLVGEAWDLGGGYAVVRAKVAVAGPGGFVSGADDKDKAAVPIGILVGIVVLGLALGMALSYAEHDLPLREVVRQAQGLKKGSFDLLQLPRFRGAYRRIAQDLNAGIERVADKGGGAPRKQADLESILGPAPAQPAMSAFAFPLTGDSGARPMPQPPAGGSGPPVPATPAPPAPGTVMGAGAPVFGGFGAPKPPPMNAPSNMGSGARPFPPAPGAPRAPGSNGGSDARPLPSEPSNAGRLPLVEPSGARPPPAPPGMPPVPPSGRNLAPTPTSTRGAAPPPSVPKPQRLVPSPAGDEDDGEATMVAAIPQEILAQATGEQRAAEEGAEWLTVYEDFVRTKKQCSESTDGLTFEKFQHTLRKNRDALIARHGCKKVRFSVYVKEGKASLKATPVKE